MDEETFEKFKEEISGLGLIEPVVLFQGKILDGKARYRACVELEIDAWVRKWEGGMNPVTYAMNKNLYRRQITPAQRAEAEEAAIRYHVDAARQRAKEVNG